MTQQRDYSRFIDAAVDRVEGEKTKNALRGGLQNLADCANGKMSIDFQGSFIRAVARNDLMMAARNADDENIRCLGLYGLFLLEIPANLANEWRK